MRLQINSLIVELSFHSVFLNVPFIGQLHACRPLGLTLCRGWDRA